MGLDADGRIYLAGTFNGITNIGGEDLTAAGLSPLYVARFGADGTYQWSRAFTGNFFGADIVLAPDGRYYLGGTFEGQIDVGDGPLPGNSSELFVASFGADDTLNGVRTGQGAGQKDVNGLAVDPTGNAVLAGAFNGTINLGGDPLSGVDGGTDLYLVKYAPDGTHLWSRKYGGVAEDHPLDAVLDDASNFVVTGFFSLGNAPTETNLGGETFSNVGGADVFVAKYDPNGVHLWSLAFGSEDTERGTGVATDAAGNVYVMGTFDATLSIDGTSHTSRGMSDIFLAKYSPEGVYQWSRSFGSAANDFGAMLATDADGNISLAGTFAETIHVGTDQFTSAGEADIFIASWEPDGTHRWTLPYGGTGNDFASALHYDAGDNLYLAGTFEDAIDLGYGPLTSAGGRDVVLLQLDAETVRRVDIEAPEVPTFRLSEPYPNPFADETHMTLAVARAQWVEVAAYDLLGRRVAMLHKGLLVPGTTQILRFNATTLPAGIYLLRASGETGGVTQPVLLMK